MYKWVSCHIKLMQWSTSIYNNFPTIWRWNFQWSFCWCRLRTCRPGPLWWLIQCRRAILLQHITLDGSRNWVMKLRNVKRSPIQFYSSCFHRNRWRKWHSRRCWGGSCRGSWLRLWQRSTQCHFGGLKCLVQPAN